MITGITAAFLVFLQIALTYNIIRYRIKNRISLGDNGDFELLRRRSAHSNLQENAPIFLLLLLVCELQDVAPLILYSLSAIFIIGRLSHAYGILCGSSHDSPRKIGMMLTFLCHIVAALLCIYFFIMQPQLI